MCENLNLTPLPLSISWRGVHPEGIHPEGDKGGEVGICFFCTIPMDPADIGLYISNYFGFILKEKPLKF